MSRRWNELVAAVADLVGAPQLVLLLLVVAAAVAALWYWFPAWVPRRMPHIRLRLRWPRLRLPRWRWRWRWWSLRRRRKRAAKPSTELPAEPVLGDELPDLPAAAFTSLADRLAAEGRYAEAVRERLRAIVRELVDRGVLEHRPGWTVTELAAVAASARPAVSQPIGEAAQLFSDIWYGERAASADDDARMRLLGRQAHAVLDRGGVPASAGAGGHR